MQYNVTRIKEEFEAYIERKCKKMCQIQNMKVTVSHYSFIVDWVIIFYHFLHVNIVRLIIFIIVGCLETISNVASIISDPSNDNTHERKVLLVTKI